MSCCDAESILIEKNPINTVQKDPVQADPPCHSEPIIQTLSDSQTEDVNNDLKRMNTCDDCSDCMQSSCLLVDDWVHTASIKIHHIFSNEITPSTWLKSVNDPPIIIS